MAMTDLTDLDLCGLKQLLDRGEATPGEVVDAYNVRINAVEPTVNGFVQLDLDRAKAAADAPTPQDRGGLFGLPFAVKDCLEVEGWITTFGTAGWASRVSECSATVVERLTGAGAILLGLTNTPELGTSIETDNLLYGRTNNPIDRARTCGGSTGGGAALVKAKALPVVIGSDFGGGSRNTAQCCGIFAHRPSLGRVSSAGYLLGCSGMKGQMCRVAPMARSVRDLDLVFDVISGADPDDPKTDGTTPRQKPASGTRAKVALVTDNGVARPEPEILAAMEAFAGELDQRHIVTRLDLSELLSEGGKIAFDLFSADAGRLVRAVLADVTKTDKISPSMQFWLDSVGRLEEKSAGAFIALMSRWEDFRLRVNGLFETYDFVVCPTGPTVAPKHGGTLDETVFWQAISYTTPWSLTASPVLVVPNGIARDGLPTTIQIVAASWNDERLLAFGRSLQEDDGPVREIIAHALAIPVAGA